MRRVYGMDATAEREAALVCANRRELGDKRAAAAEAAFYAIPGARRVPVDGTDRPVTTPALYAASAAYIAQAGPAAVAHGHELGEWRSSLSIAASARCVHCHASAAIGRDGQEIPASSAPRTACVASPSAPRYYAAKSGRLHYVFDRERPGMMAVAAGKPGPMRKLAAQMSAPAPEPVVVVAPASDALEKARAKVARATRALAKATRELEALEQAPRPATVVVDTSPLPALEVSAWVAAVREAARPLAAPCSGRRRAQLARPPRIGSGARA